MIPASLVFVPFLAGCGAEPITSDTPTNPIVAVRSDIDAKAYRSDQDGFHSSTAAGATVDSLEVTRVYLIVTGLEIQGTDENTISQVGRILRNKTMIVFQAEWPNYIADVEAVAGTYSVAKFAVQPLDGNVDSLIAFDSRYADVVTYGPSNAVIVLGHTYKNGVKIPFAFTSAAAFETEFKFEPGLTLSEGGRHELRMRFLAQKAFDANGAVMDPSDFRNWNMIATNVQSSVGFFRL